MDKTVNILLCGTGGQGVLKASEIIGWAAVFQGYHVKKSEVHGMAQRGGSVESYLRFGKEVFAPLVARGSVDYMLSFHQGEHDRLCGRLGADGVDLIDYLEKAKAEIDDPRFMNTFMLGVLSKHLEIDEENWLKAIDRVFQGKFFEENKEVFIKGRNA